MKQLQIFCDFDGTVTATDNIVAIMKRFAPEQSSPIIKDVLDKKIAIKDGVEKMFALLPSSKKEEIIRFLQDNAVIRDGFEQFMNYVRKNEIPFHIVSGGIDFFVHPMLKPYGPFTSIYCNSSNFDNEQIQVEYPNVCDEQCTNFESQACGCCKPTIIRKHTPIASDYFNIVIGDSVTDFEAAKNANLVIARDLLIENCKKNNIPYKPFDTFEDCILIIESLLEENHS